MMAQESLHSDLRHACDARLTGDEAQEAAFHANVTSAYSCCMDPACTCSRATQPGQPPCSTCQELRAELCQYRLDQHEANQDAERARAQLCQELARNAAERDGLCSRHAEDRATQQQSHEDGLAALSQSLGERHSEAQAALRQELESAAGIAQAGLQAQHDAAAAEWESMLARRCSDSKLFSYAIRGHEGQAGCVPRQIFEAEPESVLARMYNGAWEYTRDDNGRAIVNSNPAHWPVILDWLSFGAVPDIPSKALIAECRYWQLDQLLAAMETEHKLLGTDDVFFSAKGRHHVEISSLSDSYSAGFRIKGHICNFVERLNAPAGEIRVLFNAFGSAWQLEVSKDGIFLGLLKGPETLCKSTRYSIGPALTTLLVNVGAATFKAGGHRLGNRWTEAQRLHLMHPKVLHLDGSVAIEVETFFK